jgi:RNA polymerase sigma factor (sigma-70 family)
MENEDNSAIQQAAKALIKDPEGNFSPFYELSKGKVFYFIYSYVRDYAEAEDLLQNAYLALLNNITRLRVRSNPMGYLMSCAKNLSIDALRKRRKDVELDEEGTAEVIGFSDAPIDESGQLLLEIKRLLSPFEFQVFTLRVLSDLSFKEISHSLRRPIGTLTYTYSVALDKLQKGINKSWMSTLNQI